MVPDDATKYEENPSSHRGRMEEQMDGLTDRTHSYIPQFCYCRVIFPNFAIAGVGK